jgi:predicted TIM-barrel fold metal-dependent hydrolase
MTDATPPTIIDAWMQHPTPRFMAQPWLDSLKRWVGSDFAGPWPLAATLASMDEGGVARGLISAWVGPMGPLVSNDEVAAWVAEAPDRLVGIGSVDISRPMEAVRELRRCVKQLGFRGVRVLPWLWELPPTHPRFYPLLAECCELGVPFCTQVGHTGPLKPSEVGRPIPYIDQIAIDFPELVIVGGHIGYPWTEEMIAVCTKHTNVYIDTSAYTVKRYPPGLVQYIAAHGRKKVLFGTNWPMLSAARALPGIDALGLDDEARRLFLHDNAVRVFRLA